MIPPVILPLILLIGVAACGPRRDGAAPPEPAATQPAPSPAAAKRPPLKLFYTFWAPSHTRRLYEANGFNPIPLITHRFHFNRRTKRFDPEQYRRRLWDPTTTMGVPADLVGWERKGIPPGYTGWVDIDYEGEGWKPVVAPQRFSPAEVADHVQQYRDLAAETRRLRPGVKLVLHGIVNWPRSQRGRELVTEVSSHYDAVSPSVYPRMRADFRDIERQLDVVRGRLEFSLSIREKHGTKVFPIVWKRYHATTGPHRGTRLVMPRGIQKKFLELVLDYPVDGLIVYGADSRWIYHDAHPPFPDATNQAAADRSDREFMELILELIEARGLEIDRDVATFRR